MSTKPKTTESQAQTRDAALEATFNKALGLFQEGKLTESLALFDGLHEEANEQQNYRLGRSVEGYQKAIQARIEAQEAGTVPSVELAVQLKLNSHDAEGALAALEPALQAHPDHANLHYLKALALAQMDQAQPSADALAQASTLDPSILYQFRLEEDFDGLRHTTPFQAFNRA